MSKHQPPPVAHLVMRLRRGGVRRLTATRLRDGWAVDLHNRYGRASDGGLFDEATVTSIDLIAAAFGLDAICNACSRQQWLSNFASALLKSRRPTIIKSAPKELAA